MGFLFLVLYPPPRPPARPPPHSLASLTHTTHSLTHPPTHPRTHARTHALTHSLTCAFCVAGVAQSALPRGRMYALASLGSPPLLRGRRGTICTAKGSDVRPGVPWVSASFAWQAWDNVHCQGVGCTPWRPLGLRLFCVAGVAQCALPRGRMYALASLGSPPFLRGRRGTMCTANGSDVRPGVPWVSASFAWQAWHNVHCQGVGCTPWRPLGLRLFCVAGVAQCALPRGRMYALASLGSPPLLRGRHGTMCIAKGSDVRPGVPWVSASFPWQAWHNVHCQRGRMYALASLGSPPLFRGRRGTMCTAKGVGCTPWRPLGLRLFCVAGVGQCALPKGSDVRPGVPWVSASFAWQAWHNVHCQGVGCTPWRPLGLRLFCVAGVGQCAFCVAGVGQGALPRDRMYGLASLGLRLFCVAGVAPCALPRGLDVRPGVPWAPLLLHGRRGTMCILRGRRGTMCTAKGSDVRPGVPWVSASFAWQAWDNLHCQGVGCTPWRPLGLRLFCVAGVGQCALPRGWSTPWRPLGSASFAWQALTHSLTQSLTPSLHSLPHTHSHSLTRSLSLTNTHLLTYSLTH